MLASEVDGRTQSRGTNKSSRFGTPPTTTEPGTTTAAAAAH